MRNFLWGLGKMCNVATWYEPLGVHHLFPFNCASKAGVLKSAHWDNLQFSWGKTGFILSPEGWHSVRLEVWLRYIYFLKHCWWWGCVLWVSPSRSRGNLSEIWDFLLNTRLTFSESMYSHLLWRETSLPLIPSKRTSPRQTYSVIFYLISWAEINGPELRAPVTNIILS